MTLKHHLKAAKTINPLNDWFLARLVAIQFITACLIIVIVKN